MFYDLGHIPEETPPLHQRSKPLSRIRHHNPPLRGSGVKEVVISR